jgi:selenocysteine-specific elongation factor
VPARQPAARAAGSEPRAGAARETSARVAHIVVGTAGHIDHGKSTLVKALTGIDPDRLKEEKTRGITIELGFAHTAIGATEVAFVDVPGHERFVRTMLAGAGGIDLVMLVVAADESVMPQTREHFDICRLLDVPRGLVVLTKADLVDSETLELVRLEVRELVQGSFLARAPVLPVSASTGAGLDGLRDALAHAAVPRETGLAGAAVRLPIDRAFTMRGFGTVVTGTLLSGAIAPDDELELLPGGRAVKVRGVQRHGVRCGRVESGQRAAVNLGGLDLSEVARGQTLASRGSLCVTTRADVSIELLSSARALRHGARVRVHQGTSEVLARISLAGETASVDPGSRAAARLRLEGPLILTRGDRFILRAYSPAVTIGGGRILDPAPPKTGVRTAASAARWTALALPGDRETDTTALAWMVRQAGASGVAVGALAARGGVPAPELRRVTAELVRQGVAVAAGDRLVAPAALDALAGRVTGLVDAHHRASPLAEGVPREEVRERVFARTSPAVFDLVIARLVDEGRLVATDRLALASHRIELAPADVRALEAIESVYRSVGLTPPDPGAAAVAAGVAPAQVDRLVELLVRRRSLVKVDALFFHESALARLRQEVAALKPAAGSAEATVDIGSFKERYGISRKYAIPLLGYLDRERVTRRKGDVRIVL